MTAEAWRSRKSAIFISSKSASRFFLVYGSSPFMMKLYSRDSTAGRKAIFVWIWLYTEALSLMPGSPSKPKLRNDAGKNCHGMTVFFRSLLCASEKNPILVTRESFGMGDFSIMTPLPRASTPRSGAAPISPRLNWRPTL